jgi:NAD(P)-dependent dehydrogenase (short-subunit alcohol dehydrogenase family)
VLELTDADVDEMMAVNVKSALYGMQAIAPPKPRQRPKLSGTCAVKIRPA